MASAPVPMPEAPLYRERRAVHEAEAVGACLDRVVDQDVKVAQGATDANMVTYPNWIAISLNS